MPKTENEDCGSCRYFLAEVGRPEFGICRRLPPVVQTTDRRNARKDRDWGFPMLHISCWCGEYEGHVKSK